MDNRLPAVVIRFGSSDEDETAFTYHLDSCTAMNTANSLIYMWIMKNCLNIIVSYEWFDDDAVFQPLTLDCAIPLSLDDKEASKFTVVVTYKTRNIPTNQLK